MPFLLPAAATAVAAAAPAVAASTAAATAGATLTSIATNIAMNIAISAVMSALQPQVGAAGRSSEWTLSPDGPIPFAAGRIGVAGAAVHRATFGPDLMYLGVPGVLSGAGPIDAYESFRADEEFVAFDGNGKAISSQYAGELWFRRTFGAQPDVAVPSPPGLKNGAALPGWGAQHKLSGKAAYMVVIGENSKGTAFPTGEIKPLIVIRGLKGWDPRLDSTYPGGAGPCRLDNPATWVYLTNPILWALKWSLGLWEGPTLKGAPAHGSSTDYQVGGIGAKLSGVDVGAFVACANVADANGWTVCAYPTTDDDKHAVLTSFLQAGGAIYASRAGKISCIQRAAPRASVVTISAADTAGPLEIDTAASRIDRINTIRPRCMSENHRWQLTAIPEVTAQAYRDEDGGTRPRGIDYTYVSNATQAAQLAALQIANTREGIAGIIPLKPHLQKIKPGDAFTITEPGFVLNGLKCLCLSTDFDPTTKIVAVSFVSETDAKYPFALGQSQDPPEAPALEPVDPRYVSPPGETEWTVVPRPPSAGGAQIPGFDLVGEVDNATATALLVEWGPTDEGPWTQAYLGPPTAERIPLTGVQPNAVYYVSTMNIRGQNYSERRVFGPFTAPALVSDDTVNVGDMPSGDVAAAASQVPTLSALLQDAQTTLATHQATLYTATSGLVDRTQAVFDQINAPVSGAIARLTAIETKQTTDHSASLIRIEGLETSVNTPTTGLLARMATATTSLADLQTNKASVTQLNALEAVSNRGAALSYPSTFGEGGRYFTASASGLPWLEGSAGVASGIGYAYWSKVAIPEGMALRFNGPLGYHHIRPLQPRPAIPGRRYRIEFKVKNTGANANLAIYPAPYGLNADGSIVYLSGSDIEAHGVPGVPNYISAVPAGQVATVALEFTVKAGVTCPWVIAAPYILREAGPIVNADILLSLFEDVTDRFLADTASAAVLTEAAARVSGDTANATQTTLLRAQVAGLGDLLNPNGTFLNWPDGQILPPPWDVSYGLAAWMSRAPGVPSGYAADFTVPVGQQQELSMFSAAGAISAGWYVMELDYEFVSGETRGAGMRLLTYNAAGSVELAGGYIHARHDTATFPAIGLTPAPGVYRFRTLVEFTNPLTSRYYLGVSAAGLFEATTVQSRGLIRRAGFRPATPAEIEAKQARGAYASLSARYAATDQAIVDLNAGKASVTSVTDLRASLNAQVGNEHFVAGKEGWYSDGGVAIRGTVQATFQGRSNVLVADASNNVVAYSRRRFPVDTARKYRVIAGLYVGPGAGVSENYIGLRCLDGAGNVLASNPGYYLYACSVGNVAAGMGWKDIRSDMTSVQGSPVPIGAQGPITGEGTGSWAIFPVGTKSVELLIFLNYNNSPLSVGLDYVGIEDMNADAGVTEVRSGIATLEGRLEGRALLQTIAGNQVAGMQLLAVSGPDASYSAINFWATAVQISNGGSNPVAPFEVRGDVVRMRSALIDRLSVTTAITVGSFAFPVALEARLAPAADGEVISYGGDLGQVPTLVWRTDGLDPLNAGESYLQYAENHTATGFIARRKIQTPATPSAYNLTGVTANAGGGPTTKIERGANPKSADDTYTITGTGYVTFYEVQFGQPTLDEQQTDTVILSVWQRMSGVWTQIGWLYIYAVGERPPNQFENGQYIQRGAATSDQFTCSASVEAWGCKVEYGQGGNIVSVAYTAQGGGSGIRSATSGGQRPIVEVRIKNG